MKFEIIERAGEYRSATAQLATIQCIGYPRFDIPNALRHTLKTKAPLRVKFWLAFYGEGDQE